MVKWKYIIDKIFQLITAEGSKIVIFNVEAERDPKAQFEKYQTTCETVKNTFEAVVTASLPGEERIFWPYKDIQFYIGMGEQKVLLLTHGPHGPPVISIISSRSWVDQIIIFRSFLSNLIVS